MPPVAWRLVELCFGMAAVVVLDILMFTQIASFIRQSGIGGYCGSWCVLIQNKMLFFAFLSSLAGIYAVHTYVSARNELNPLARFLARQPLVLMVALLLTWFVLFPVVKSCL